MIYVKIINQNFLSLNIYIVDDVFNEVIINSTIALCEIIAFSFILDPMIKCN